MMRPLKELVGSVSPIEAEAIDLLRAASGQEPPAGQKQRVRARLLQQRVTSRAAVLRPAVVVSIVLCAAAASAAVGRHWIAHTVQGLVSPSVHRPAVKQTASSSARRARVGGAIATPLTGTPGSEIAASEAMTNEAITREAITNEAMPGTATRGETPPDRARVVVRGVNESEAVATRRSLGFASTRNTHKVSAEFVNDGHRPSAQIATTKSPPVPTVLVARDEPTRGTMTRAMRPAEDTGLVFDAMRALRQEGQPARASNLLDEYLRRHPSGGLAEEALALSVEAAVLRRDPGAGELAELYMARYSSGHFRAAVESARRRLSP